MKLILETLSADTLIEAKEDGEGNVYFGEGAIEDMNEEIVIDFDKSVTRRLKEG